MEKLNFEEIADKFSNEINKSNPNMSSISRCDWVVINNNEIIFIEETSLENKDLYNPTKYRKEIIENVKKMWGSFSIFTWYFLKINKFETFSGIDRIYLIYFKKDIDNRLKRTLANLMKSLKKYKNSSFSDIKYKILSE